jgi:Tfp pilus assembly protein PilV
MNKRLSQEKNQGVTFIEVILYSFLLSLLLSGFIEYACSVHTRDVSLMQDIIYAQSQ